MTDAEYAETLLKKYKVEQGDYGIEYVGAAPVMSALAFLEARVDHLYEQLEAISLLAKKYGWVA